MSLAFSILGAPSLILGCGHTHRNRAGAPGPWNGVGGWSQINFDACPHRSIFDSRILLLLAELELEITDNMHDHDLRMHHVHDMHV